MSEYKSASGSTAEDMFIDLFADTFGAEKAGYLYSQYHFYDIYQNDRFADFFLESGARKIAIEIDDEASHNKSHISENKFYDDLLKQNSMIHKGWDVFRWAVRQMQIQPDTVKDELRVFIGTSPTFREAENYLPEQRGKSFSGFDLIDTIRLIEAVTRTTEVDKNNDGEIDETEEQDAVSELQKQREYIVFGIDETRARIAEIKNSYPYKYKAVLDDPEQVKEIQDRLKQALADYKKLFDSYRDDLEKLMKEFGK